ncbi:MAG: Fur family transcriptional regulator [Rhizobiaceae bacterium]
MPESPSLTKNQSLVLQVLQDAEAPLSAYVILARLRPSGFRAPLQVYRALDRLIERGAVHKLESINAFLACFQNHDHGHHHGVAGFAICDSCGHVSEFEDHDICHRLEDWARSSGFAVEKSAIELHGRCAACSAGAA